MTLTRREALLSIAGGTAVAGLPRVKLGGHTISRLIVGGNPISGTSHVSAALSREMIDYFSAENAKKLLRNCEQAGINTWQSRGDRHILRLLNEYRREGGRIQWIAQTASELADIPRNIRDLAAAGAIGIYHHGSATDRFWKEGRIERARELLKRMREAGVQVGLGTHIPEVIDYVEAKAWDVDFYMTCLYDLSRSPEEASRLSGAGADEELFWEPDREEMLKRVRRTSKTCLVFKIYGAGRRCGSSGDMLGALRQVFAAAKPSDCVVVGMFPKHQEQVLQNCALVAEAIAQGATT
jgi:pentatricopeptide repeat protein